MQKHKELDRLHKHYGALLTAIKQHNIIKARASMTEIANLEEGFWNSVRDFLGQAEDETQQLQAGYTDSVEYTANLAELLKSRNIQFDYDEKNTIQIGPLTITPNVEEHYLQIKIGRKRQQITTLEPGIVLKHIEKLYRRINSSFNANSFFRRLQKAYEFANTRVFNTRQPKYGFSVPLKDIFDLFTLSPAATDYKLENFLWDLGRLHSKAESIDKYTVELGYSRDEKKMYLIRTAQGDTIPASTLTIHKIAEDE